MHKSLTVTDQVYGVFGTDTVKQRLAQLGDAGSGEDQKTTLAAEIADIVTARLAGLLDRRDPGTSPGS